MTNGLTGLRIGIVAAQASVNVQTLRYYERRGLLPKPDRTAARHRQYQTETVQIVRFIKRAQNLGFTLSEIHGLLGLRAAPLRHRAQVRELATAKLNDIETKIRRLRSIRRALAALVESCACEASRLECPILEALSPSGDERR